MTPGDVIATITYVCLAVSCVSVSLRIVVRYKWLDAGLRLDDWFMIAALGWYLFFCAFIITLTIIENRNSVLTEPVANLFLLILALAEAMFMLTSIALKFSLMIFFRQFIFERTQRNLMTLVTAFYCIISAASFFLAIFPCGAPIHLARKRIENQCVPPAIWNGLLYTHGTTSALSDWIFALLPILVLWKSSMPARTKFGVTLLMVLAVCGSLCAVLRTIYTGSLDFDERDYDADNESNYYHTTALVFNVAVLEMGIGITAASVACLMPLFRQCAGWGRRHLTVRSPRNDLEGRDEEGVVMTMGDTSSKQGRKCSFSRLYGESSRSGNLDMEMLGILPSLNSSTGEVTGEVSHEAEVLDHQKSSFRNVEIVP